MKRLSWLNNIIGVFKWKFGLYKYRVELISDNPVSEEINDNVVYVVGGKDYVKWAYLKCPDNCGKDIMLNLSENREPSWKVKRDKIGRVTLHPSIHKLDGCKSHFWIKKGKLKWA